MTALNITQSGHTIHPTDHNIILVETKQEKTPNTQKDNQAQKKKFSVSHNKT